MPCGDPSSLIQLTTPPQVGQAQNRFPTLLDRLEERSVDAAAGEIFHNVGAKLNVRGAYIHVPFCFHKCHYCDFYSIVDNNDRQQVFVDRLIRELRVASPWFRNGVESLFVGGGTPTLLRAELWQKLLPVIGECLPMPADEGEFTVEANPETVTRELIDILLAGGVNRISIGAQSFNPKHLKTLERWHDPKNVHRSVEILRAAGISNFNLDLIFAVPGQTLDHWQADLDEALSLGPAHISCYGLMYEHNTPLTVRMRAGEITPVEQDEEAAMYAMTIDRLTQADYEHYEISNWAKAKRHADQTSGPTRRCVHNLLYWSNADWWAFGPSASGHLCGLRWKNVPRLGEYLDHGPWPRVVDVERVTPEQRIGEEFMLGLRLVEGMADARVKQLLDQSTMGDARRLAIDEHVRAGLLARSHGRVRLTRRGLMLADTVLSDLV